MSGQDGETGNHSAARLLAELDYPIAQLRDEFVRLQDAFVAAIDPVITLLFEAAKESEGHRGFAVRQMLVRAVNDLVVGFHLLCHGYLNQAYNVMRVAYEACDLLELIQQDPAQAELWVISERPQRDFSPGRVRQQLGRANDPIYSAFCEVSHPRFAASRLTGFASAGSDDVDEVELVVRLGPFLIDDHPAIGHAAAFLGTTLARVANESAQLVSIGAVPAAAYEQALRDSVAATSTYMGIVSEILVARGQPEAANLDTVFTELVGSLANDDESAA